MQGNPRVKLQATPGLFGWPWAGPADLGCSVLGLRFGGFARKLSRDIQGWKTALSAIVRRVCMITLQGAGAFQASGSSQLVELFIDSVAATLWISWVFWRLFT